LRVAAAAACAAACLTIFSTARAADLVSPVGPGAEPPPPWRVVGLPQQAKALTRFSLVVLDGQRVLRVEADNAYGNLVHPLQGTRAGILAWRWRVDRPAAGADLRLKSGDDVALKVCAFFDMPIARVPFVERQLLRFASARAGYELPTATLCYVWDNLLAPGTLLDNAYTRRVRYIAAGGHPGQWSDQAYDLAADFRRAFGDETPELPPLTAVVVGADTDNTGSHSVGYVSDLRFEPAVQ
jgi:hypothetical protein